MIKEYNSSSEVLTDLYMIVFLIVITSEIIFFIDMFFIILILLWSVMWSLSGFYLTDPNKLIFSNTIVLSCISLWVMNYGISFIYSYDIIFYFYIVILVNNIFIDLQWYDFNFYSIFFNDYIIADVFYIITGLHLMHLILGLLISSMSLCYIILCITVYVYDIVLFIFIELYLFIVLQLVYWHFLEMLWLFINYNLCF